jgi:hypothetical protein
VVGDDVDDQPQAVGVGVRDQGVEVGERAEQRVDAPVVGHVVPAVGHGGGLERGQPDRVHAQLREVGQAGTDPLEVADSISRGVGEAANVDLVNDGVTPPRGVLHMSLAAP